MGERLSAPLLDNKIIAQTNIKELIIPFTMSRSVGEMEYDSIELILKSAQSNIELCTLSCPRELVYKKDGEYWGTFQLVEEDEIQDLPLKKGQYYKVQLAYKKSDIVGFYSSVAIFKFTKNPTISIKNLALNKVNQHTYRYTGQYSCEDVSEKVYSYQFYLYDSTNSLVATSGECLHNSAKDNQIDGSIDEWEVNYGLEQERDYLLVYEVITINGIKKTTQPYKIVDGQTVYSNIFKYSDFIAINIPESACVQLALKPKEKATQKLINGKFILLRTSSEDGFSTWREMTRFALAAWDTSKEKIICNDYCVTQGVTYIYGLQAYNDQNVYSLREETKKIQVDFEDMFLSDGQRQLRIQFNPKVSSLKNTILESKMDTIGSKYPFFFRNGNVKYKEFPISGLISIISDMNSEFISGTNVQPANRFQTPAADGEGIYEDALIQLTGENFRKERDFKLQVLDWLTNGKPKLFRSPGEGNFIVRLMNTSMTPNDTLGRMIHTFSSTAYEVADCTFDNLRKYGMMVDDYLETRDLKFFNKTMEKQSGGKVKGISACVATLSAKPSTKFFFKLRDSVVAESAYVGSTGKYVFPNDVLQENPLIELWHEDGKAGWPTGSTLIYAEYVTPQLDAFSFVHSVDIKDKISQWIGQNKDEIDSHFDKYKLINSIGLVYYLNISQRPEIEVTSAQLQGDGTYKFKIDDIVYTPGDSDLIFCVGDSKYYCGKTKKRIGSASSLNYNFRLRDDEPLIDLKGTSLNTTFPTLGDDIAFVSTGGRIVLTNVKNVNCLFLGNALYVDIAYQEVSKTYTAELTSGALQKAKSNWLKNKTDSNYTKYCNLLMNTLGITEEDLIENAL